MNLLSGRNQLWKFPQFRIRTWTACLVCAAIQERFLIRVGCAQAVQKGLADLAGPGGAEAAADSLRLVDTYIKVRTSSTSATLRLCTPPLKLIPAIQVVPPSLSLSRTVSSELGVIGRKVPPVKPAQEHFFSVEAAQPGS